MLDEYIIGDYRRNSPEASVPIINFATREHRLGGLGNVALNLKEFGIDPVVVTIIGNDNAGDIIETLLHNHEVESVLIKSGDRPTTVKQRIVDRSFKQYLRIDTEEIDDVSESDNKLLKDAIDDLLTQGCVGIVVQDYNKGIISSDMIKYLSTVKEAYSLPVFVDPKKSHFRDLAELATVFKPNLNELESYVQKSVERDTSSLANALATNNIGSPYIFITMAEDGVAWFDNKNLKSGIIGGENIDTPDVSGAGDSVLSAIIWAYLKGENCEMMASIGNKAGASACKQAGVSIVLSKDILGDIAINKRSENKKEML